MKEYTQREYNSLRAIRRHTLWTRGFTLLYKHAIAEIQLYYTSKHYGSTT